MKPKRIERFFFLVIPTEAEGALGFPSKHAIRLARLKVDPIEGTETMSLS